ncbi:helix-turn-helix domain-containing protein [Mesorhizobium sp. ANAO-SY3R2]|uniref:helix-turn-helix domain-containing protein n=1 Tax=Mesorhizobium sp. ANAO-SY3R2 TaxID=3166644 RepID=UPI00366E5E8F
MSYSLGFRDPGNFSHFFKRRTGMSPARYRAIVIKKTSDAPIQTSSHYHDWPLGAQVDWHQPHMCLYQVHIEDAR